METGKMGAHFNTLLRGCIFTVPFPRCRRGNPSKLHTETQVRSRQDSMHFSFFSWSICDKSGVAVPRSLPSFFSLGGSLRPSHYLLLSFQGMIITTFPFRGNWSRQKGADSDSLLIQQNNGLLYQPAQRVQCWPCSSRRRQRDSSRSQCWRGTVEQQPFQIDKKLLHFPPIVTRWRRKQ